MQSFLEFAAARDFQITNLALDGELHRFQKNINERKKNAWYVGWQNFRTKTGEQYTTAVLGDWKTGEKHVFQPDRKSLSREDNKVIKEQMERASRANAKKRHQDNLDTAERLDTELGFFKTVESHPYLVTKKILAILSPRYKCDRKGNLIILMEDIKGKIWGRQAILPDGQKFFMAGQKTKGCFHVIGEIGTVNYLCEGFATGASIHLATKKSVVIAFNAGNLIEVAKELAKEHPDKRFIVAGDDDTETEGNPGRTKAERAALILQSTPVFPKGYNDFNDLHAASELDEVKRQLENLKLPNSGFVPLGYTKNTHLFYSHQLKDIVEITNFTDTQMFMLADKTYWEELFPAKRADIDWSSAKNSLINLSKKIGRFNVDRIRGIGVWRDDKNIIINTGDKITGIESGKYFYLQNPIKKIEHHDTPLTNEEAYKLIQICSAFNWRENKSGFLLAGWLAVARIAGALTVRPHLWLTGGAGTGKSTLMEQLINPALGGMNSKKYFLGGSTEAGIRQTIRSDAVPLIFDEFETNDNRTGDRVQTILELLRQSWSQSHGMIVKGTANGSAQNFNLNMAALVSSIRVTLQNEADQSRFSVLELKGHNNDIEHWEKLSIMLEEINEEYGERLFARSVKNIGSIVQSQKILQRAFAAKYSQRVGQQYGMLLAGYCSLMSNDPITEKMAKDLVNEMSNSDINADDNIADHNSCFDYLLSKIVRVEDYEGRVLTDTIGQVLADGRSHELSQLEKYGLRFEEKRLWISNSSAELTRIFKETAWSTNWNRSMRRQKELDPNSRVMWIGGSSRRAWGYLVVNS